MKPRPWILLVRDRDALLLEPGGEAIPWDPARVPRGAAVHLILGGALEVRCQDAPDLDRRERREVHERQLEALGRPGRRHLGEALDPDPGAEGGHVLWTAASPSDALDPWLQALADAGLRPVQAIPWQRAYLAALPPQADRDTLHLALAAGEARLFLLQGRGFRTLRTFPVPEVQAADALARELGRFLPYLQQRHRGARPTRLFLSGPVPDLAAACEELGLEPAVLGTDVHALLAEGALREHRRGGALDLLPPGIREAGRRRAFRRLAWGAVLALAVLVGGAKAVLVHQEHAARLEAVRAEAAAAARIQHQREGEAAARIRLPLLRVRWAEARQEAALERLEQLGVTLLDPPPGVILDRVEAVQVPGDVLAYRFTVSGHATSGRSLSIGPLATYVQRLAARGLRLSPIKEVAMEDLEKAGRSQPAVTRFHLEGTLP